MKRRSRPRLARVLVALVVAALIGVIAPSISTPPSAVAATDGQMVYPASGIIQSKVGDGCRSNHRVHDGIDISGQGGTPVLAAYDGTIRARAWSNSYGNYVDIEHPGGYVTRYAHMVSPGLVAPGGTVVRGQQIGVVGNTGASTGAHLHFEVWRNGSVYSAINEGFVCLSTVGRGNPLPHTFPGLRTTPTSAVNSADYDRDGKADLLGISAKSDLTFLAGTGNGGFRAASPITSGWSLYRHLTHADLNADGRADMLAVRSDGLLEFYAGGANGGFDQHQRLQTGWGTKLHVASGADYTGDGLQDVLAVSSSGVLTIHRGNGTGALPGPHTTLGSGWSSITHMVGGDFNGDGIGDIMAVANDGNLYYYRGLGNRFSARVTVGGGWKTFTGLTGGVDYTGDKKADLVARAANGDLYLYAGTGAGKFQTGRLISSGWGGYIQLE
ncbi:VCBS repeat domain-containing M23 family metallopeptidase [Microbacterium paludicola]|uniref:VCBS repeat domain-containing M23 family metallopeptidase n=1 Tax=Microbacterium paludicola TaxID=300019 RepID=UPI0011AA0524|nr:VCBS repeat domain-containing M23 family metallopeptidase [Microbacterium paludicola]